MKTLQDDTDDYTTDEFINEYNKTSGTRLDGYILYDSLKPEFIIFGRSSWQCPGVPIPKKDITRIRLKEQHYCIASNGNKARMWRAEIFLKDPSEGNALDYYVQLLALYSLDDSSKCMPRQECSCQGSEMYEHVACDKEGINAQSYENPCPASDYDTDSSSCRRSRSCPPSVPYLYCRNGRCHCTPGCNSCRRSSSCPPSVPYLYCRNGDCHCTSRC